MATEMHNYEYQFEIETIITQFLAIIDNAIVMRYEKDPENGTRTLIDEVQVLYVVGPKQRIVYNLQNKAKNYTLPLVAVSITGIRTDKDRILDKNNGVFRVYQGELEGYARPVPITISVKVTIYAKFFSDVYQIWGKIASLFQPYAVYSWAVPCMDGYSYEELRNKIEYDLGLSLDVKEQLTESDEDRASATMNFSIQGWLFPQFKKCVEGVVLDIGTSVTAQSDLDTRVTFENGLNGMWAYRPLVDQYTEEYKAAYLNPREFATAHPHIIKGYAYAVTAGHNRYSFPILPGEQVAHDFFSGRWGIQLNGYRLGDVKALLIPAKGAKVTTEKRKVKVDYKESVLFPNRGENKPKKATVVGYPIDISSQNSNNVYLELSDIKVKGDFDIALYNEVDYDLLSNAAGQLHSTTDA